MASATEKIVRDLRSKVLTDPKIVALDTDFTWVIDDWNNLVTNDEGKVTGPTFEAYGFKWSLIMYPNGYAHRRGTHISAYIEIAPADPANNPEWAVSANFALMIWNPVRPSAYNGFEDTRSFSYIGDDSWGFHNLYDLKNLDLLTTSGRVNLTVYLRIYRQ
ncbi:hypothetical protein TRVA0_024S01772 [Trichomonascus vanleenenianus]|uniref:uncharacterized protein n=1 Tax=Trichomonascus vanleenenianus TaxID=2268995 RepID=UPI003ECBA9C1